LVRAHRSRTVDGVAAGISSGTRHRNLNVFRVVQHSVPRVLTQNQRYDRVSICGELIDIADEEGMFLNRTVTGGETWCFLYGP
jgi:hypothetical protein